MVLIITNIQLFSVWPWRIGTYRLLYITGSRMPLISNSSIVLTCLRLHLGLIQWRTINTKAWLICVNTKHGQIAREIDVSTIADSCHWSSLQATSMTMADTVTRRPGWNVPIMHTAASARQHNFDVMADTAISIVSWPCFGRCASTHISQAFVFVSIVCHWIQDIAVEVAYISCRCMQNLPYLPIGQATVLLLPVTELFFWLLEEGH